MAGGKRGAGGKDNRFPAITATMSLKQRMKREDAVFHALCDKNPDHDADEVKTLEVIFEKRMLVDGGGKRLLVLVPCSRLHLPGNFVKADKTTNFEGMSAVGYVREAEPNPELKESIEKMGFSQQWPAIACPMLDMEDPEIKRLLNEGDKDALVAYCDSLAYLSRPTTPFVVVDGANRWKICFAGQLPLYVNFLSIKTSLFERLCVASLMNKHSHAMTKTTWVDNVLAMVQASAQHMTQDQIVKMLADKEIKSRSQVSMFQQLYSRVRHFWGPLTMEVKKYNKKRMVSSDFHSNW